MFASATKKSACPCCHGTGTIEENATLVGIAPLLDRPSDVNDDEWDWPPERQAEETRGEETAVCEVPVIQRPNRGEGRRALPVIARDPEQEIARVQPRDAVLSRSKTGRLRVVGILVAAILLGSTLGAFAGIHADRWIPAIARILDLQRSGARWVSR
jgi:hypothetical protein